MKTIKEKITAYYVSEDGTWLVEKGKVKEAKLIKEAFQEINELEKDVKRLEQKVQREEDLYYSWYKEEAQKRKSMEDYAEKLEYKISSLMEKLQSIANDIFEWND